jgi:hypothetical protein
MASSDLNFIIENHQFFSELSLLERDTLVHVIHKLPVDENQKILPSKIVRDSIYIVCRGEVIIEYEKKEEEHEPIRQLMTGDVWFGGELADTNDERKIIINSSPKAMVMVIRLSDLFYQVRYRRIYNKICVTLGVSNFKNHIQDGSHHHYLWFFNRDELEHRLYSMQIFLSTVFLLICIYIFFMHFSNVYRGNEAVTVSITLLFTLLSLTAFYFLLKKTDLSPSVIGLTLTNTRISVEEALVAAVPLLLSAIALKYIITLLLPAYHDSPIFDIQGSIEKLGGTKEYIYTMIIYVFLSIPLQELVFRGGMQGYLQILFSGRRTMWQPILIANIVFATFNLIFSPLIALVSFFPGLYWGWLFAKHNNLIGVCVSHAIFAATVFFVVGL